jgi:hypothetical protein
MLDTELPPEVMFFTSLPNISANLDIPYAEMSRFCHGGFMPQAYASFGWDPQYMLDVVTYREFHLWSEAHELERPVYPVLGLYRDAYGRSPLPTDEVRAWCEALSGYRPTFFSVYRASAVPKAAWPLLAEIQTTPEGQVPPRTPDVEGEYVTVRPGDTVAKLCARHNCSWNAFWAWNGHLWDAQSKKHEPELMEYGWIVRVG